MRNRRIELGRPVKFPGKIKKAPPQLNELLLRAVYEGDDFAPQYLEQRPRRVQVELNSKLRSFEALARKNPGTQNALTSAFLFSLSHTILANPDEERWLIKKGLHISVEAQNRMVMALLGMRDEDRLLLMRFLNGTDLFVPWINHYQANIAVARFAFAANAQGVSVRMANSYHDIHRKIDLFCEPPYQGMPTLCVQIKSNKCGTGALIYLLKDEPREADPSLIFYKVLKGMWRGVNQFNREYHRNWLPMFVRVGLSGAPIQAISDPLIEADICEFFTGLAVSGPLSGANYLPEKSGLCA